MPNRVQWEPTFEVGHELIDNLHKGLIAQCNALADLCTDEDGNAQRFDASLDALKRLVREHFAAEASMLEACGYEDPEDHQTEWDEFEYLATDVATAENFDHVELQRFFSLWCVGHVTGASRAGAD